MEDERIIEMFFARDENAIAELTRKYGSPLRSISMNILHSAQDAEECLNDACLKIWNCIPPDRPERLLAFIAKIMRNLSINKWKQQRTARRGGGEVPLVLSELEECIPGGCTVDQELDRAELSAALSRFLTGLPEIKRTVFLRRYWYLVPVKDIAEQLGMSESRAKSMLARTRNALRKFLEKEGIAI